MSAKLTIVEIVVRNAKTEKEIIVRENINVSEFSDFADMAELLVRLKIAVEDIR